MVITSPQYLDRVRQQQTGFQQLAPLVKKRKDILVVGDLHGKFRDLLRIIRRGNVRDAYVICVGDVGIGFNYSVEGEFRALERLNSDFLERNITFIAIRGNHDNPTFFDGIVSLSNIRFLKDYTYLTLSGKEFLFVGGAISIDRTDRVEGKSYWKGEKFVLDLSKVLRKPDVLITHTAPSWIGPGTEAPIVSYWSAFDPTLIEELKQERIDMDKLYAHARPKQAYCGHFHTYAREQKNGTYARILDELEMVML